MRPAADQATAEGPATEADRDRETAEHPLEADSNKHGSRHDHTWTDDWIG